MSFNVHTIIIYFFNLLVLSIALKMNYLLITFVVMYFSFNLVLSKPGSMYTTEFDNINVEEILHSKRMLKNYMDCVMDRGSCTRDGAELKSK